MTWPGLGFSVNLHPNLCLYFLHLYFLNAGITGTGLHAPLSESLCSVLFIPMKFHHEEVEWSSPSGSLGLAQTIKASMGQSRQRG